MFFLKKLADLVLTPLGKRITNINSPAKPYKDGVAFLKKIIDKPDYIIDIGFADGTPDLTDIFPMSENKYLLIEANPQFHKKLDEIKLKHPNAITEKSFCGEKEGEILLNISRQGYESSIYRNPNGGETLSLPVKTLDSIIEKNSINGRLFLKIDVEGAEIDVLKGATKTLEMTDVAILETWINVPDSKSPGDFGKIVEIMYENDFVVFDFFGGHSHKSGVLAHIDTVFVKKNSKYREI